MAYLMEKRYTNMEIDQIPSKKKYKEVDTTETIELPSTPIEQLKVSFNSVENKILEQALNYCNMDVRAASLLLQREIFLSFTQQITEDKPKYIDEVLMSEKNRKRNRLVQAYLDALVKAETQENAIELTRILLKNYKTTLNPRSTDGIKKNSTLKKGINILVQRYDTLCQTYKEEQSKVKEKGDHIVQMINEIEYYKSLANTLSIALKE